MRSNDRSLLTGQYTAVADDPETLRVRKNMETISNVSYHGELARRQEMENTRPNEYERMLSPSLVYVWQLWGQGGIRNINAFSLFLIFMKFGKTIALFTRS